jgi:hypothetical protein
MTPLPIRCGVRRKSEKGTKTNPKHEPSVYFKHGIFVTLVPYTSMKCFFWVFQVLYWYGLFTDTGFVFDGTVFIALADQKRFFQKTLSGG